MENLAIRFYIIIFLTITSILYLKAMFDIFYRLYNNYIIIVIVLLQDVIVLLQDSIYCSSISSFY